MHGVPQHRIERPNLYLAAGGLSSTCLCQTEGGIGGAEVTDNAGWLVVGLGIDTSRGSRARPMDERDWARVLAEPRPTLRGLDGHFAVIRWDGDTVTCFTDQLGGRHLYLAQAPDGIIISTQLDWVSRLTPSAHLTLTRLGSHWLGANQFSHDSLVDGIRRLSQGGYAVCTSSSLKTRNVPWALDDTANSRNAPSARNNDANGHTATAKSLQRLRTLLAGDFGRKRLLSLGLSGGLDSRHLLAVLQSLDRPYALHVFGADDDSDVRVSRQIADGIDLRLDRMNESFPTADACIAAAKEYAASTCAKAPASACLKFQSYQSFRESGRVLIDGAFGEIARRGYYRRLSARGITDLRAIDSGRLAEHLSIHKANVFTEDARRSMMGGFSQDLAKAVHDLPDSMQGKDATMLDLFAIRYRFPNFFGLSQGRVDARVLNFMPYAQPSYLRAILRTPIQKRKGAQNMRRNIRALDHRLTQYPRVKGQYSHPYILSGLAAMGWMYIRKKMTPKAGNDVTHRFLEIIREFVLDLAHDTATQTFEAYDCARLKSLITQYYRGESRLAAEVDWWLSFELWRRSL